MNVQELITMIFNYLNKYILKNPIKIVLKTFSFVLKVCSLTNTKSMAETMKNGMEFDEKMKAEFEEEFAKFEIQAKKVGIIELIKIFHTLTANC